MESEAGKRSYSPMEEQKYPLPILEKKNTYSQSYSSEKAMKNKSKKQKKELSEE